MQHNKILEHFTKDIGLLDKIFGKSNSVMYDETFILRKQRLEKVYKKYDVEEVFPNRLDEEKMKWILDILFRVPTIHQEGVEEQKKKFLGIF